MSLAQAGRTVVVDLIRNGRGWILSSIALGWFFSLGVRLMFPALVPYIRAEFGISIAAAGLLYSMLWVAYAAGQLPGGLLGDQIGAGNTLVLSTVLSAVTILVVSLSLNVWMLFAGTVLYGLSTAPYGPTRLALLSELYPKRDGTAIGITFAAGNLGNTLLPVGATVIATALTWRLGFAFVVPLFLVAALVLWRFVPGRTASETDRDADLSRAFLRRVVSVATRRRILVGATVAVFGGFVFQGLTGLYPTYLVESKGLTPTLAATLLGTFFASGVVVQIASGLLADRFGVRVTLMGLFVPVTVGLFALPFVSALPALVVVSVMMSSILGYMPVVATFLAGALPEDVRGSGLGLLRTSFMMLGATGPVVIGVIADAGFFDEGFLLLGVCIGISLLLSTRLDPGAGGAGPT